MAKRKAKSKAKPGSKTKLGKSISVTALKRAIEGRDARTMSGFYSDDAELHIVDRDNPPSKPNTIVGKDAIASFFNDVCGRDMTHKLVRGVADDRHIAFTQSCAYPDGTKVLCSTMIELEDGMIVKQTVVQAWDG